MTALARTQTSDCANPALDLFTSVNGVLTDVYSVEFQIFDVTGASPVQVYPATLGDRVALDVDDLCPVGDKVSTGRYVATWTVPSGESIGTHQIKWFFKLTSGSDEQTFIEEFEVLAQVMGSTAEPNYAFVSDMRAEGVPSSVDDAWLWKRINLASRFIERATNRFFYPKSLVLKVDGRGGSKILLNEPIISIAKVEFDSTPFAPSATEVDMDLVRVYNRHLSQGLLNPDDRDNPKLELFHPAEMLRQYGSARTWSDLVFPVGQQNVTVTGVFGYTDPDGSLQGKTPDLIVHVCKLLVIRELDRMANVAARFDRHNRQRLTSERTRDQAYTMEGLSVLGGGRISGAAWTGDPEIDTILVNYARPPILGAA